MFCGNVLSARINRMLITKKFSESDSPSFYFVYVTVPGVCILFDRDSLLIMTLFPIIQLVSPSA